MLVYTEMIWDFWLHGNEILGGLWLYRYYKINTNYS